MAKKTLMRSHCVRVNRSGLRQKQRETLNQAKQNTVVVVSARDPEDEKLLVDKKYFDELIRSKECNLPRLAFCRKLDAAPRIWAKKLLIGHNFDGLRKRMHVLNESTDE